MVIPTTVASLPTSRAAATDESTPPLYADDDSSPPPHLAWGFAIPLSCR